MSSKLQIEKKNDGSHLIVLFSGSIDEDSDFSALNNIQDANIIFDFESVSAINSCGIREWIKAINGIKDSAQIIYRQCPQVIIEQMNIVKGFVKAGAIVESFYAPYYDQEKDQEVKILIRPSDVINGKAPLQKNANGADLEFDDIEAQYFNFLKNK